MSQRALRTEDRDRDLDQLSQALSVHDLPPPNTKRWVVRRKAAVVAGVRNGVLSLHEACERYNLSVEEFLSWEKLIERHGVGALRTTRLQRYRQRDSEGFAKAE
ncbi:MAG: DUF1153 domain-containing protein [Rhodovibrionaceae bacterium]